MITTNVNGNPISQGFIDEIRSDAPRVIARLWYDDAELECDIVNATVQKGSCGSETFSIGNVIGNLLQATVKNLHDDIKGKTIEYHIGAWVSGAYEYISLGEFKVAKVDNTRYQSVITAYSGIVADSGGQFDTQSLVSTTIADIAIRLQSDLGCSITFDNGIDTTLEITETLEGLKDYEVLQIVATCCGGYAINNNQGDVLIKRYDATPTLSVDTGMMVNLPIISEQPFRVRNIGVLVSEASVDNEGNEVPAVYYTLDSMVYLTVMKSGTEYYLVDENGDKIIANIRPETADLYLASNYITEDIFQGNVRDVVGYEYYPATIDLTLGDPRLEGSDVLEVTEVDGTIYTVPCHKIIHKYTGGFVSLIESADATDEDNDIGTTYPVTEQVKGLRKQTVTAQATADNAFKIADDTAQYFWFWNEIPSGADPEVGTGAHISEVSEKDFNDPLSDYYHKGGNLIARSNGIAVRNGLIELATFGATGAQIGVNGEQRLVLASSALDMYNSQADNVFHIGETASNYTYERTLFYGTTGASNKTIILPVLPSGTMVYIVSAGAGITAYGFNFGTADSEAGLYTYDGNVTLTLIQDSNNTKRVYYQVTAKAPAWTLGVRNGAEGAFSSVIGYNCEASGYCSHAEGGATHATVDFAHAEGNKTIASEICAHAEGASTTASGIASHAGGFGTKAQGDYQTAIGKYNIADSTSLFIIGNGTSSTRSNAFTVKSDGNVRATCNQANTDMYYIAERSDTGTMVAFGVGSSGVNHGIWSTPAGKWLIHGDGTNTYVDGYSMTPTALTKAYSTNSYVSSTAFNRIEARQYGRLVIVNGNLEITTALPKSTAFLTIGTINLPSTAIQSASQQVPCSTSGDVNITVNTDGTITLYNYKTTSASGWARFNCTLIL